MVIYGYFQLFSIHWISGKSLCRVKPWVEGVTKMGPALSYHLVHPYFGKALDLGLYPTHNNLGWKFECNLDDLPHTQFPAPGWLKGCFGWFPWSWDVLLGAPQLLCLEVLVVVRALHLGPWVMYWVPRMERPDYNIRLTITWRYS